MPARTGTDVAREITALQLRIPVLLMTGFGQTLDQALLDETGVVAVLKKPFNKYELACAVRSALDPDFNPDA